MEQLFLGFFGHWLVYAAMRVVITYYMVLG